MNTNLINNNFLNQNPEAPPDVRARDTIIYDIRLVYPTFGITDTKFIRFLVGNYLRSYRFILGDVEQIEVPHPKSTHSATVFAKWANRCVHWLAHKVLHNEPVCAPTPDKTVMFIHAFIHDKPQKLTKKEIEQYFVPEHLQQHLNNYNGRRH